MVFVITGTAESGRNTVGRLLAETLGWEFIDAENLPPPGSMDARGWSASLAGADRAVGTETLSAAIKFWIYQWRDVVVSCPMLTESDRRQLSRMSALVKVVCLEASHVTTRSPDLDRSVSVASHEAPAKRHAVPEPAQDMLTVDSSRQVEDIIAEITAVLIRRKSPWFAHN
jgi:gluconokinase